MHPNAELIDGFYRAFAARDHAAMRAAYAPGATFKDEVFDLRGPQVGAMWHMLCDGGRDLALTHSAVEAGDDTGRAHWEARYTFTATGRPVHNIIDAVFRFENGRILAHRDHFSFWHWSRQALGPSGLLLGWTPLVRAKVQSTARARLQKFMAGKPEYR
jgi:ketosteroid isomerase-like protein